MMKIVVAMDSFKGSVTSSELNQCVNNAIASVFPSSEVCSFSIADGGEGSLEALFAALGGEYISVETVDLLLRPMEARYLRVGEQAYIESASVVGIDKISPSPETFEQASSFGLGALLEDALSRGCKEIFLTLGGTGSSDGGRGLLEYFNFNSNSGDYPLKAHFNQVSLIGLTDVNAVYTGDNGYAMVFGRQKGATEGQIRFEDSRAKHFALHIKDHLQIDLETIAGTGAAGGLGGALVLLGGQLLSGIETIASIVGIEDALSMADLVITGEGHFDSQSSRGKVPGGVARLAKRYQVPTIAVCGAVSQDVGSVWDDFVSVFSIQTEVLPLPEAMKKEVTLRNLYFVIQNILRTRFL